MTNLNPRYRPDKDGNKVETTTTQEEVRELTAAYLQTHNQLQKIYLLLAEKGQLTHEELAYVTGEGPKPGAPDIGTPSEPW